MCAHAHRNYISPHALLMLDGGLVPSNCLYCRHAAEPLCKYALIRHPPTWLVCTPHYALLPCGHLWCCVLSASNSQFPELLAYMRSELVAQVYLGFVFTRGFAMSLLMSSGVLLLSNHLNCSSRAPLNCTSHQPSLLPLKAWKHSAWAVVSGVYASGCINVYVYWYVYAHYISYYVSK